MDVSAEHLVAQARERFQLQDYYGAIHLLEEVLTSGRAFADAHQLLGVSYGLIEQPERALEHLDRALELNPNYATAHQWLGRHLFACGKIEQGLTEAEVATRLDPLSAIIASDYGLLLGVARRWDEALAVCQRALALQPDFRHALLWQAAALTGLPANAPSRSTMWRYSKPCASKSCACAAGSRWNTVARAMSPCSSRTQTPSLRSMAGKRIMVVNAAILHRPACSTSAVTDGPRSMKSPVIRACRRVPTAASYSKYSPEVAAPPASNDATISGWDASTRSMPPR